MSSLLDNYNRPVKSMRIQVNTTCNFKCFFCHMEGTGINSASMTPDEIERAVKTAAKWGVNKVKFTGGEPTLRNDIVEIVERTRKHISGNISMTTNGVMIPKLAEKLKKAGLDRVNISLHSIDREGFEFITGTDFIDKVVDGIRAAKKAGLYPIKINFVVLKDVNIDQIPKMIELSAKEDIILQLIEFETTREEENSEEFLKYHVPLEGIEREVAKNAVRFERNELHNRPKYTLETEGGTAEVEFVKPMRNADFCSHCTRMRLTSTGLLKTCLMRDDNYTNLIHGIRGGKDADYLDEIYIGAVKKREPYWKPEDEHEGKNKVLRTV